MSGIGRLWNFERLRLACESVLFERIGVLRTRQRRLARGRPILTTSGQPPCPTDTYICVSVEREPGAVAPISPALAPPGALMLALEDLSAWRGFRKIEKPKCRPGRPREHPELNRLYGFPVEVIAERCAVSRAPARGYKMGRLKPSKLAPKLFRLDRERMALTPQWNGWVIKKACIVDRERFRPSRAPWPTIQQLAARPSTTSHAGGGYYVNSDWFLT